MTAISFELPAELEASEPPEARGLRRDQVRMMVSYRASGELIHANFAELPDLLAPGDVVVVNTSATLPAAVDGLAPDGTTVVVHFSTRLDDGRWVVEVRHPVSGGSEAWTASPPPRLLALGEDARIELVGPYRESNRLWTARLETGAPDADWLATNGRPIRYRYVDRPWPLSAYQNAYAAVPGSAEMPSAGRPFTPEVVTRLVASGVVVAPVVLHTGVSSLEHDEDPYPERAVVPGTTARLVNVARESGSRVIAVGTTVVRALETAADPDGTVVAFDGWTDLVVTPERRVRAVDGLLTGWHEPRASHLLMLEAFAGRDLLQRSYAAAVAGGYRWHEFGDVHLLLP